MIGKALEGMGNDLACHPRVVGPEQPDGHGPVGERVVHRLQRLEDVWVGLPGGSGAQLRVGWKHLFRGLLRLVDGGRRGCGSGLDRHQVGLYGDLAETGSERASPLGNRR